MKNPSSLSCPVGELQCHVIDQAHSLRQQVTLLEQALRTDLLTGLYNYRYLQELLAVELERSQRTRMPTALIMLDLDRFKQVNDTLGHEAGNGVLQQVAQRISQAIRRIDTACRYGGEEFSIVLPGTTLNEAVMVAERVRRSVGDRPLALKEKTLTQTVSLGVELYEAGSGDSIDDLVRRADACLYRAKEAGRNRVAHGKLPPSSEVTADERAALFS